MKKNIDDLFKNHEVAPPEMIWNNIERELLKKKERKVIPIWLKYAGVAAVLLIGFFIGKEFSGNKNTNVVPLSAIEVNVNSNKNSVSNEISKKPTLINKNQEKLVSNDKNESKLNNDKININENNDLVSNDKIELLSEKKSESFFFNKRKSNLNETNLIANSSNILSKNEQNKVDTVSKNLITVSNKNVKDKNIFNNEKLTKNISNNKNEINEIINNFDKPEPENKLFDQKNQLTTIENQILKKDTIAKMQNILEHLLAKKTKKKLNENKTNKWLITPNIAPIYANSTSNNSTIDSKFDNNSKSYEKNISLGLAVNYALTKKISIRTAINIFDVGYNTKNIGFYKNTSIISNLTDATAIISSDYTISNNLINQVSVESSFNPNQNPLKTEGILNQKTAYLEVPLEVSYAILDKKFGINLITGFSTLILNKNQVSIVSNNNTIDLGQADNVKKIHYSTNIGLGFNYKFAKSFQVNFEPMFKYQINTFSNDVGDYKPYFIGIYSGISYSF